MPKGLSGFSDHQITQSRAVRRSPPPPYPLPLDPNDPNAPSPSPGCLPITSQCLADLSDPPRKNPNKTVSSRDIILYLFGVFPSNLALFPLRSQCQRT